MILKSTQVLLKQDVFLVREEAAVSWRTMGVSFSSLIAIPQTAGLCWGRGLYMVVCDGNKQQCKKVLSFQLWSSCPAIPSKYLCLPAAIPGLSALHLPSYNMRTRFLSHSYLWAEDLHRLSPWSHTLLHSRTWLGKGRKAAETSQRQQCPGVGGGQRCGSETQGNRVAQNEEHS